MVDCFSGPLHLVSLPYSIDLRQGHVIDSWEESGRDVLSEQTLEDSACNLIVLCHDDSFRSMLLSSPGFQSEDDIEHGVEL